MGARRVSATLRAALAYARLGWRMHPIEPGGKRPLLTGWPERATTEPAMLQRWWRRSPGANLAVATGPGSGLLALDVDGPEGERTLAALERQHGSLPALYPMQWTGGGRGGWQAFFSWPEGRQIGNSAGRLGAKLDTRGHGGYALLPPSATAQRYRWAPDRDPRTLPPAPPPGWLLDLLDPPPPPAPRAAFQTASITTGDRYLERAIAAELALIASAPEGRRNAQLNEGAYALFRFADQIEPGAIAAALQSAARHAGLDPDEITSTVSSAAKARGVRL
jgi:hypothetical protein